MSDGGIKDQAPLTNDEIRAIGQLATDVGRQLSEFAHAGKNLEMLSNSISDLRDSIDFATKSELEEMKKVMESKSRRRFVTAMTLLAVVMIVLVGNIITIQSIRHTEKLQSCNEARDIRDIITALSPESADELPPLPRGCQ